MPTADEPLPTEAIRDLLGVARAMRAVHSSRALDGVVRELEVVLSLAHCPPHTLGGKAARRRADTAVVALGELVSAADGALPIIEASVERVRRARRG